MSDIVYKRKKRGGMIGNEKTCHMRQNGTETVTCNCMVFNVIKVQTA